MNNGKKQYIKNVWEPLYMKYIQASYSLYILDSKVKIVDSAIPVLFFSGKYLLAVQSIKI